MSIIIQLCKCECKKFTFKFDRMPRVLVRVVGRTAIPLQVQPKGEPVLVVPGLIAHKLHSVFGKQTSNRFVVFRI
jgi:hypothetical protein